MWGDWGQELRPSTSLGGAWWSISGRSGPGCVQGSEGTLAPAFPTLAFQRNTERRG